MFKWADADKSLVVGSPAIDTVNDFELGDVLNLVDLLPDTDRPNYVYVTQEDGDTTIHVTNGQTPSGAGLDTTGAHDVQQIVLAGYTDESSATILAELLSLETYNKGP